MLKILGAAAQNLVARTSRIPIFVHIWIKQLTTIYKYASILRKLLTLLWLPQRLNCSPSILGLTGVGMYIVGRVAQSV
jgi:hypothetical protein